MPQAARTRLRKYSVSVIAGDPPPLARALRMWVMSLLQLEAAAAEAEMAREQCTPVMQACCECLCDLYGCHDIEDDLPVRN